MSECVYNDNCDWDSEAAERFQESEAILLVGDGYGVYVPQAFAEIFGEAWGLKPKDLNILTGIQKILEWVYNRYSEDTPSSTDLIYSLWQRYWDTMLKVENYAAFEENGKTYRLDWYDGNLFALPEVTSFCEWCEHAEDCEDREW